MSIEKNIQIVKDFFAAIDSGDKQRLLSLVAEDIEWIVPGEDWPLAGTHRGHAGLAGLLQKASEEVEMTYSKPPEFVAQGERVLAIGVATGKIKATNKTFEDHWVFDITVRNGKLTNIREYIDTQALARASEMAARFAQWQGRKPQSIAADASYGNGRFLQWLMDRGITPYMPTRDAVGRTRSPFYGPECLPTYRRATATSVQRASN